MKLTYNYKTAILAARLSRVLATGPVWVVVRTRQRWSGHDGLKKQVAAIGV
jgi:hypothetical protein